MKRVVWSLIFGLILPILVVLGGSFLSFGQPFLVLQAIGDLLVETIIWPLQLCRQVFPEERVLSLGSLIATYVIDVSLLAGAAYIALGKGLTRRLRLGVPALIGLVLLCAPWWFSYKPSSAKLEEAFPQNSRLVFEESQEVILYSIETTIASADEAVRSDNLEAIEQFQGYRVLGKVSVRDPILRKLVKKFLYRSIDEGWAVAACFNPRHGIRAIQNDKVVDMVICFECSRMVVYADGQKGQAIVGAGIAEHYFNRILRAAGIPLSK